MDEKDKEVEALDGAPLARVPLTEAELDELHTLHSGGIETALEWRAAALAAHPFLLAEVKAARAWRKEAEARIERLTGALRALAEGFDHVANCRVCGDMSAQYCGADGGGAALDARGLAGSVLTSASECG